MKMLFLAISLLFLILLGCTASDSGSPDTDLVTNGSFTDGLTGWNPWSGNGAYSTMNVNNGVFEVSNISNIKDPSIYFGGRWDVVLDHGGINLQHGHVYQVSVDAWADSPREINIATQENGIDLNGDGTAYTGIGGNELYTVGTTMQTISFTYYHENPTNTNAKLQFAFGKSATATYLDNASIKDITASYVDPAIGVNMVVNGDFSMGLNKWDYRIWNDITAMPSVASGELQYAIASCNGGTAELIQSGIVLLSEHHYEVKVSAWAEADKSCSVTLDENSIDLNGDLFCYTPYLWVECPITTTKMPYTFTFLQTEPTNHNARINLRIGTDVNDVFFDDISVKSLD